MLFYLLHEKNLETFYCYNALNCACYDKNVSDVIRWQIIIKKYSSN